MECIDRDPERIRRLRFLCIVIVSYSVKDWALFHQKLPPIIRNADSLTTLEYIDHGLFLHESLQLLTACVTTLEVSEHKPRLCVDIRVPLYGYARDRLLDINKKISMTEFRAAERLDDGFLPFLSRFHDLELLEIWPVNSDGFNGHGPGVCLGELPLRRLILHDIRQIASLPRQLLSVDVGYNETSISVLTNACWTAVCNLKCLSELGIQCLDIERMWDEEPFVFQSSNLHTLRGYLVAKTEEIVMDQIIQPIIKSCLCLTFIDLQVDVPLSSNFLALLLSTETLRDVKLRSDANSYSFRDISALHPLPNLESLQLPWPAAIGIPPNGLDDTEIDWRFTRDHSKDVMEPLPVDQCQRLAEKFPNLNEIVFRLDIEALCNAPRTSTGSDTATVAILRRNLSTYQISAFIEDESRCMQLCSAYATSFLRGIPEMAEGLPFMSLNLRLFLSQLRQRHDVTEEITNHLHSSPVAMAVLEVCGKDDEVQNMLQTPAGFKRLTFTPSLFSFISTDPRKPDLSKESDISWFIWDYCAEESHMAIEDKKTPALKSPSAFR